jgi:hypothetical protein
VIGADLVPCVGMRLEISLRGECLFLAQRLRAGEVSGKLHVAFVQRIEQRRKQPRIR